MIETKKLETQFQIELEKSCFSFSNFSKFSLQKKKRERGVLFLFLNGARSLFICRGIGEAGLR